jgi:hypothetical protein
MVNMQSVVLLLRFVLFLTNLNFKIMSKLSQKTSEVTIKQGSETRIYNNTREAYKEEVKLLKEGGSSSKQAHASVSSLFFGSSGKTSGPKR